MHKDALGGCHGSTTEHWALAILGRKLAWARCGRLLGSFSVSSPGAPWICFSLPVYFSPLPFHVSSAAPFASEAPPLQIALDFPF